MVEINNALVVGGGIGGMATALRLCEQGIAVDLIDLDPQWRVYGAGITITGATLRAFKQLGVLEEIEAAGAFVTGQRIHLFNGTLLTELDEPPLEEGLPAAGGIMRPVLHAILSRRVIASHTQVRLGVTVDHLTQSEGGVHVLFTDGTTGTYGIVVGADGINSKIRTMIFPDAVEPVYTGQGSWRIVAERPANMTKGAFYLGHENLVGMTACSASQVYVFILNPDPEKSRIEPQDQYAKVRELLADFGGDIAKIRETVGPETNIVYRPLESAFQQKPWHNGGVILIGDAVHATTPHLASGAGMAVEDALVLTEELARRATIENAFVAFTDRRFERCRLVVENSLAIGRHQLSRGPISEQGAMMSAALHALSAEI